MPALTIDPATGDIGLSSLQGRIVAGMSREAWASFDEKGFCASSGLRYTH
jgi:hypothetical protein